MADFSFIVDPELRQALEADYAELGATIQAHAWKAAHVMAGSVIEAVLVYYLVSTKYQSRNSQAPLKMSFDDLIGACKREHILTDKTADLSSAVKRYRNLIHPGRVLRLEE